MFCLVRIGIIPALATLLLIAGCREKEPQVIVDPGPVYAKTLLLTKTAGYRHSSIDAGVNMFTQNADSWLLDVIVDTNASQFTSAILSNYKLVVLLNTTGDVFNDEQQLALQSFIKAGGRLLAIHAATDAEYNWPWYGEMLGAWFSDHPEIQEASCKVELPQHMAANGLPAIWKRTDEWYNFKKLKADNEVIISIDEQTYKGGTHGSNHPISWTRKYDGGKIFYTAMGHTEATYADPLFIQHMRGAIFWLMAQ